MMTTSQWMDVVSNNLANAGTDGYKSDSLVFTDILTQKLYANGGKGKYIGSMGNGPTAISEYTDLKSGPIKHTGNNLDVALKTTKGMFAIDNNGRTEYSRNGAFQLNTNSELVNNAGHHVLDDRGQKITLQPTGVIEISPNGEINQDGQPVAKLGIYEGSFTKDGENLWTSQNARLAQDVDLSVGALEGSNVEPIHAMIDLIKVQRSFEMSQKSVQTQDEMNTKLFEMLRQ